MLRPCVPAEAKPQRQEAQNPCRFKVNEREDPKPQALNRGWPLKASEKYS